MPTKDMNRKTTTTNQNGKTAWRLYIDEPGAYLDQIQKSAERTARARSKATELLARTSFHGNEEITDFESLRRAVIAGTPVETAKFKTALSAIETHSAAAKIKRTDEPARIVDCAAYLEGLPECYFKLKPTCIESYNLKFSLSAPAAVSPEILQNRAAALVALIKHLKARRAAVKLTVVDYTENRAGSFTEKNFTINTDSMNIGQIAFFASPAFLRTFSFLADEELTNHWKNSDLFVDGTNSFKEPTDPERINFKSIYQQLQAGKNLNEIKAQYLTPEAAYKSIQAEFNAECNRLKAGRRI